MSLQIQVALAYKLFSSAIQKVKSVEKKKQNKNVIFEVIIASEIYNRFYSFHEYWEKFSARQENVEAILGSKI